MIYPDEGEFLKLAEKGRLIPVSRKLLADLETPISLYQKLCQGREHAFLLESVEGNETLARYSFLGYDPLLVFSSTGDQIQLGRGGEVETIYGDPWQVLRQQIERFGAEGISGLPRFWGGALGYFGYDLVRFLEDLPRDDPHQALVPDCYLIFPRVVLVFDHYNHQVQAIINTTVESGPKESYRKAVAELEEIDGQVKKPLSRPVEGETKGCLKVGSNMSPEGFAAGVKRIKEHIRAGDAFQVVLSRRVEVEGAPNPFAAYRVLRNINPSPYMFYLDFGDLQLAGASPEPLVRVEGEMVQTRPIAGTRPRGTTAGEDWKLEDELRADPKERAEHVMLVDLARNDLGRVCRYGSVQVTELMRVERFSHVMHLVSDVEGRLREGRDALDVLAASFPAGTVSGAPKVRAMEIIAQLEPTRRGPYAGAVGYVGFSGHLDTCITIRTILFARGRAYVQAGAGVVADSDPEGEYRETMAKAQALLRALELAREGIA